MKRDAKKESILKQFSNSEIGKRKIIENFTKYVRTNSKLDTNDFMVILTIAPRKKKCFKIAYKNAEKEFAHNHDLIEQMVKFVEHLEEIERKI